MSSPRPAAARARVLLVQRRLPLYRVPLFEQLRAVLGERGIALTLAHGEPNAAERLRQDEGRLEGALRLPVTRYAWGDRLVWQPFRTAGQDLVIVSQENRLLFNHWLCRPGRPFRLGFFGHGGNLTDAQPSAWRERFKQWTTRRADWWFAYTAHSAALVARAGMPAERVTVLNNSTDTRQLRRVADRLTAVQLAAFRAQHGLTEGQTALFLGALYAGKGLDLLLDAGARVAAQAPRFRLLVAGEGPLGAALAQAASQRPWLRVLGPLWGADKALALRNADVLTLPGAVGLSLVDALSLGVPLLCCDQRGHGPELSYLQPGRNGWMSAPTADAYAHTLRELLADPARLAAAQVAARDSACELSLEAMVQRFAGGIEEALACPRA